MSGNERTQDPEEGEGAQKEPIDLAVSSTEEDEGGGNDSESISIATESRSGVFSSSAEFDLSIDDDDDDLLDTIDVSEPMDVDVDVDDEVSGYFPDSGPSIPDEASSDDAGAGETKEDDYDNVTPPLRPTPTLSPSSANWMNEDRNNPSEGPEPKFSSDSESDNEEEESKWSTKVNVKSEPVSPTSEKEELNFISEVLGIKVEFDDLEDSLFIPISAKQKQVVEKGPSRPEYLKKCGKCGEIADFVCQGCYRVAYCSKQHQEEEWQSHRQACLHFRLDRHPSLVDRGPFYVDLKKNPSEEEVKPFEAKAKVDIDSDDPKIFEEKPFLMCPWPKTRLNSFSTGKYLPPGLIVRYFSCFGCGKVLGFSHAQCKYCKLFLCSRTCPHISNHQENECRIIQQFKDKKTQDPRLNMKMIYERKLDNRFLYMDVMILRFLLKLDKMKELLAPEKFEEEWYKLNILWKFDPLALNDGLDFPRDLAFSYAATKGNAELISKLYCLIKMNSFALELPFRRFRALCTVLSVVPHSCVPNCRVYLSEPGVQKLDVNQVEENPNDITVVLKAGKKLQRGESLTFSFVPLTLGTLQRAEVLKNNYGVTCTCIRCKDVTECGTYCTNIKCTHCSWGIMVPTSVPNGEFNSAAIKKLKWECRIITGIERRRRFSGQYPGGCATIDGTAARNKFFSLEALLHELARKSNYASVYKNILTTHKIGDTYYYFSHILGFCEDILRGDFLPLPDVLADDLSDFNDDSLFMFLKAKQVYRDFMQKFIPKFAFEGFPIANFELIENELDGRRREKASASTPAPAQDHDTLTAQNINRIFRRNGPQPQLLSLQSLRMLQRT